MDIRIRHTFFCVLTGLFLLVATGSLYAAAIPTGKTIAVVIYESTRDLYTPGKGIGAAESIVKRELLASGYPVVNEAQLEKIKRSKAAAMALQGNAEAIMQLGKSYNVKILLRGQASMHEPRLNEFQLYTATANISVQAYSTANGKYIFSDTVMAKEVGYTPDEAREKALAAAAQTMARNIISGEGSAGGVGSDSGPVGPAGAIRLVVTGISSFSQANEILSAVQHTSRVSEARMTGYEGGTATIELKSLDSPKTFAGLLSRTGLQIRIQGISANTVTAEAY
jgi:hypothetical protein